MLGGGGIQLFLVDVCHTGSKSRVLGADFPWKMRGLVNKNFGRICILRAEILQKF